VEPRRNHYVAGALVAALAVGLGVSCGSEAPAPSRPGSFAFAALGDAPYNLLEDRQYRLVLRQLDAHDLSFVLHVGDIFWRPCTDQLYRRSLEWFNGLRHPVVYTPGDNEWFDCWEPGSGGFGPRERLERIREIFFAEPTRSLGRSALPLVSQAGREPFPEFVEHARWTQEGTVFATLHLPGSRNGMRPFPGRTAADDDDARRRTAAATAWLRETFAEAQAAKAAAVVLGFHANPGFEEPVEDLYRQAYEPFLTALEEEVESFSGPVLIVHGDDHEYLVDRPLVRRTTGRHLANLMRLQVPGSPEVGWVRVSVTPGAAHPFAFAEHVVPRWRFW
jgi:hypothetical protein